ncbi:MAG: DUF2752 domain-containing protein [Bacteroides sp.]|nr:DUF2752 domain-containing protein [Bacteroides sp.]
MQQPNIALYRRIFFAGIIIALCGLVALYFFAEPSSGLYPRCAFKALTGLSCPGCGSQRAVHSMLRGEFKAAFAYNALFMIEIPLLGLLALSRLPGRYAARLQHLLSGRNFILIILATIIIWTIVRNIFDV